MAGQRFKTGYLSEPLSFTDMGRLIGQDIEQSVNKIQDEKLKRSLQMDQQYGFSEAMNASVPASLPNRYRGGAQIALEEMQRASAQARMSNSPEDISAYTNWKNQYSQIVGLGTAIAKQELPVITSIRTGSFQGLAGTTQEALSNYAAHDQAQWNLDENGQLVVDYSGQGSTPWNQSPLAEPSNVYAPVLKWEGSTIMPAEIGKTIYDETMANQVSNYQVFYPSEDGQISPYQTGDKNLQRIYADTQDRLDTRFMGNPTGFSEAISIFGYKANEKRNGELTEQDLAMANTVYNPQVMIEYSSLFDGEFNEDGEFVYATPDEDVEGELEGLVPRGSEGSVRTVVRNLRKAKAQYYEASVRDVAERVAVEDETGKYNEELERRAQARVEALIDSLGDEDAEEPRIVSMAPALAPIGSDGTQFGLNMGRGWDATVEDGPVRVIEAILNDKGLPISYRLQSPMTQEERFRQLREAGASEEDAKRVVESWFAKWHNTTVNKVITNESTGQFEINPLFLRIHTGILNPSNSTSSTPSAQELLDFAALKVQAFQEGTLASGYLTNRGFRLGSPDEAPATEPSPTPTPSPVPSLTPSPVPSDSIPSDSTVVNTMPPADSTGVVAIEDIPLPTDSIIPESERPPLDSLVTPAAPDTLAAPPPAAPDTLARPTIGSESELTPDTFRVAVVDSLMRVTEDMLQDAGEFRTDPSAAIEADKEEEKKRQEFNELSGSYMDAMDWVAYNSPREIHEEIYSVIEESGPADYQEFIIEIGKMWNMGQVPVAIEQGYDENDNLELTIQYGRKPSSAE